MAGQNAELGNLASTTSLGVIYWGEGLSGAVVSLHEWSEFRVIGRTFTQNKKFLFLIKHELHGLRISKFENNCYFCFYKKNKEERYSRVPRLVLKYIKEERYSRVPRLSKERYSRVPRLSDKRYSRVPRLSDTVRYSRVPRLSDTRRYSRVPRLSDTRIILYYWEYYF